MALRLYRSDEPDELEELDDPPPPPPPSPEELELEELELDADELEEALELLLAALELGELEDEEDVAEVGVLPPQAVSIPTPARAAPPERRTRNSRLSVSAAASSRVRSSSATFASSI